MFKGNTQQFDTNWFESYIKVFHWQGLSLLGFWMGSFIAEDIRREQYGFPFMELTGEPGAGRSTMLEFCWKLLGRDDYEGFDYFNASPASRRRIYNGATNNPIVLLESEEEIRCDDRGVKAATVDDFKPYYNFHAIKVMYSTDEGSASEDRVIRGSIVLAQDISRYASLSLLRRVVHCHMDKVHHKAATRHIAKWFERQHSDSVGGFDRAVSRNKRQILDAYFKAYDELVPIFQDAGIKAEWHLKNHVQVAACGHALSVIFPAMSKDDKTQLNLYLIKQAMEREAAEVPYV